jgi:hypothetical protein
MMPREVVIDGYDEGDGVYGGMDFLWPAHWCCLLRRCCSNSRTKSMVTLLRVQAKLVFQSLLYLLQPLVLVGIWGC